MTWTDKKVALLTRRWDEGHSANEIAKELGDLTRNAVISKIHRLGLASGTIPKRPLLGTTDSSAAQTPKTEARARKVFVSHAAKHDGAWAMLLVSSLESLGCGCWLAPRDIPAGAEWNRSILQAVEASAALLLLVSEAAAKSAFVHAEVQRAFDCRIPVLQVVLNANVDVAHIDMRLLRVQRISASDDDRENLSRRVVEAIKAL